MSVTHFAHASAHVGQERTALEDFVRVEHLPQGGVAAIVCDGMGGAVGGALAARTAGLALLDAFRSSTTSPTPAAVRAALVAAHDAVSAAAAGQPELAGMGTTAVVVWCEDGLCYVGWVGDSRMYLFRDGKRLARTTDHTRVMEMVMRGELSQEQAANHPQASVLAQAIGQRTITPAVFEQPIRLAAGDVILLCSDGLYEMMPNDDDIYRLIAGRSYADAVTSLIDEANRRGAHDNIGVALVVVGERRVRGPG